MKHTLKQQRSLPLLVIGSALALSVAWLLHTYSGLEPIQPVAAKEKPHAVPLDMALEIPPPTPVVEEADPIRQEVRLAIDPDTPLALRTERVLSLALDLTEPEYRALLHEIIVPPQTGTPEAMHSSHVHEICKVLQRIPASHDLFANTLATVAANRQFTEVYRDYAFQHLRILWFRSLDPKAPGVPQPRNLAIEETFRRLLADRPETAAQAILGLHEIRHDNAVPAIPNQEISRLVHQIIEATEHGGASHLPSRMTAIRIIAERNLIDAHETLRSIASSQQEHLLARTSAIGALGHAADPANVQFLKSLSTDSPLISEAVQHALRQF